MKQLVEAGASIVGGAAALHLPISAFCRIGFGE